MSDSKAVFIGQYNNVKICVGVAMILEEAIACGATKIFEVS